MLALEASCGEGSFFAEAARFLLGFVFAGEGVGSGSIFIGPAACPAVVTRLSFKACIRSMTLARATVGAVVIS